MSSDGIDTTVYQSQLYRIRSDLIKAEGDYLFLNNIMFPEGNDWKALNYSKIQLRSVEVEVKPYYNFATMSASGAGKISGDFPIYVNFYTGNTVAETVPMDFSQIILSGKYVKGSATTGVKAEFGSQYFKTVLAQKPQSEEDLTKANIATKMNDTTTIDDFNLDSDKVILQKGRVVVCVRQSDFHVPKENFLSAPNSSKEEGSGSGSTAGAILKHLKAKVGEEVQEVEPKVKKSRKGGNPGGSGSDPKPETDSEYLYPEDPIVEGEKQSLILDYSFWLICKYNITYWRNK